MEIHQTILNKAKIKHFYNKRLKIKIRLNEDYVCFHSICNIFSIFRNFFIPERTDGLQI